MSSWLDTKRFVASLAKNAISEAQKTLDKALDIDEGVEQKQQQRPLDQEAVNHVEHAERDQDSNQQQLTMSATADFSQWGSFTGSFFPAVQEEKAKRKAPIDSTNGKHKLGMCSSSKIMFFKLKYKLFKLKFKLFRAQIQLFELKFKLFKLNFKLFRLKFKLFQV